MTLHDIPHNSKIYEGVSDGSTFFTMHHPDGMYSYCVSERGGLCHLYAFQELVPFEDGFKFAPNAPEED